MDVKKLKQDKDSMRFLVKGTTAAYMNTLRRMILNRVPTMAIEEVTFIDNGSALYDEFLAHRLGLIPLVTDSESYFIKSKCKCKGNGCARCELNMTLEKKGPCSVYAEDIKSADPKVKSAIPKLLIAKLLPGQNLKFEAKAILGGGKQHMKFAPGQVYYQGYPEITIDQAQATKIKADQCPQKILELDGKKLKVTDETECNLCKACQDASPEGAIKIEGSEKDFILTIEPWGQLSAKEMVATAITMLDEDLEELKEAVKGLD